MGLSEEQTSFLVNYLDYQKFLDKRKAEQATELAALKPTQMSDTGEAQVEGVVAEGEFTVKSVSDRTADDNAALTDMLKSTGRIDPDATSAKTREQLKEEHLRKIYIMDEHGINMDKIEHGDQRVPPDIRALALEELRPDLTPERRKAIEDARQKVARQNAFREHAAIVLAKTPTGTGDFLADTHNRSAALNQLADDAGVNLLHYASRHGPQTTLSEQAARIVTGHPPDHPDTSAGGSTTHTIQTGQDVTVPNVTKMGSEDSTSGTRVGSAELGLQLIENGIIDAQIANAAGQLRKGGLIKTHRYAGESDPAFGDGLYLNYSAAHGQPINHSTGTLVPKQQEIGMEANQVAREAKIAERAVALKVDEAVRGSTVISKMMYDGSVQTVTAFPDLEIQAKPTDTYTGDGKDYDPALARQQINALRMTAAQVAAKEAIDMADKTRADLKLAEDALAAALTASAETVEVEGVSEEGRIALTVVQTSAIGAADKTALLDGKEQALVGLKASQEAFVKAAATMDKEIVRWQKILAKKPVPAADEADLRKRDLYHKMQEFVKIAEAKKSSIQTTGPEIDKEVLALETEVAALAIEKTQAEQAAAAARVDATSKGCSEENCDRAAVAGQALAKAKIDKDICAAQLPQLELQAQLAQSLAREIAENALPTDAIDDADIAKERKEREDALVSALEEGPEAFADAQKSWQMEIDAISAMEAADHKARARSQTLLSERSATARDDEERARVDLKAAIAALERVDTADAEGSAAATLQLDQCTMAMETAQAQTEEAAAREEAELERDAKLAELGTVSVAAAQIRMEAVSKAAEVARAEAEGSDTLEALRAEARLLTLEEAARMSLRNRMAAEFELAAATRTHTRAEDMLTRFTDVRVATELKRDSAISPEREALDAEITEKLSPREAAAGTKRTETRAAKEAAELVLAEATKAHSEAQAALEEAKQLDLEAKLAASQ